MGIVLQFQSLPNSRRQASAPTLPSANQDREAKIIIFPGIRVNRDKACVKTVAVQRSVGDGPAE
ncbi:MAG: hypothetical protein C0605_06560 [Hyphomicrobiales bacterium]|nr:MAG: hypothetical protein C0605_06560 [Hyphomicrobiales bacterium]